MRSMPAASIGFKVMATGGTEFLEANGDPSTKINKFIEAVRVMEDAIRQLP